MGWLSYRLIEARSSARLARDRIRADFPGWDVTFEARLAPPQQESATDMIETARRWRADCVFIGAEKMSSFERMFCGNLVASVAARAECSVEVVRGPVRYDATRSEFPVGAHHKDSLPIAS